MNHVLTKGISVDMALNCLLFLLFAGFWSIRALRLRVLPRLLVPREMG
jgi:hypothetical protein